MGSQFLKAVGREGPAALFALTRIGLLEASSTKVWFQGPGTPLGSQFLKAVGREGPAALFALTRIGLLEASEAKTKDVDDRPVP